MDYNYHTHTTRCGHATGTAEEYVQRAIDCGIAHMGFSDHSPFIYPDGYEEGYRVPVAQAEEYVQEIASLREKYCGKIVIKIGFEMEYYEAHFNDMLKMAVSAGAEYLILGQHFLKDGSRTGRHTIKPASSSEELDEYVSKVNYSNKWFFHCHLLLFLLFTEFPLVKHGFIW